MVYYPQEDSFFSHNERKYLPQHLSEIAPAFLATLPAVVDVGEGAKVAIAESDVDSYPGLWLKGTSGNALAATFPPYPLKESLTRDRDYRVVESADYIAVTAGHAHFSLARDWHRRPRWRPAHQSNRLSAGKALAGAGHVMDQARESGLGLVELQQCLRRGLQGWSQHGDV